MKEVLPTEYCPISSTIGRASNHASDRMGSRSSWYRLLCSSGRSLLTYSCLSRSRIEASESDSIDEPKPAMPLPATGAPAWSSRSQPTFICEVAPPA